MQEQRTVGEIVGTVGTKGGDLLVSGSSPPLSKAIENRGPKALHGRVRERVEGLMHSLGVRGVGSSNLSVSTT
jgi:hypothetical protein